MKRRIYTLVIGVGVVLSFFIFYRKANRGYPQKVEIDSHKIGETLSLGRIKLKVNDVKVSEDNRFVNIDIEYANEGSRLNIARSGFIPIFYQNYTSSIAQNVDEGIGSVGQLNPMYKVTDFNIKQGEKNKFTFIYQVYPKGKFENALLINPYLYKDIREDKYKSGSLYYRIIDLGDIYD